MKKNKTHQKDFCNPLGEWRLAIACFLFIIIYVEMSLAAVSTADRLESTTVSKVTWNSWEPLPSGRYRSYGLLWEHYALIIGGFTEKQNHDDNTTPVVLWTDLSNTPKFQPLTGQKSNQEPRWKLPNNFESMTSFVLRPILCLTCIHTMKEGLIFCSAADALQGGDELVLVQFRTSIGLKADTISLNPPEQPRQSATFAKRKRWVPYAPAEVNTSSYDRVKEEEMESFFLFGGMNPLKKQPVSYIEMYDTNSGEWVTLVEEMPTIHWRPERLFTNHTTTSFCNCSTINSREDTIILYGCWDCEALEVGVIPFILPFNAKNTSFFHIQEEPQNASNHFFYKPQDMYGSRGGPEAVIGPYIFSTYLQNDNNETNFTTTNLLVYDTDLHQSLTIPSTSMSLPRTHCALFAIGVQLVCAGGLLYDSLPPVAMKNSDVAALLPTPEVHWEHANNIYFVSEFGAVNFSAVGGSIEGDPITQGSSSEEDDTDDFSISIQECTTESTWFRLAADSGCGQPLPGISDRKCAPSIRFPTANALTLRPGERLHAYLCFSFGNCAVSAHARRMCSSPTGENISNVVDCLARPCCWDDMSQKCYMHVEPPVVIINRSREKIKNTWMHLQKHANTIWTPVNLKLLIFLSRTESAEPIKWSPTLVLVVTAAVFLATLLIAATFVAYAKIRRGGAKNAETKWWVDEIDVSPQTTASKSALTVALLQEEKKTRVNYMTSASSNVVETENSTLDNTVTVLEGQYIVLCLLFASHSSRIYLAQQSIQGDSRQSRGGENSPLVVLKAFLCTNYEMRMEALQEFDFTQRIVHPHIMRAHKIAVLWNPQQVSPREAHSAFDSTLFALAGGTKSALRGVPAAPAMEHVSHGVTSSQRDKKDHPRNAVSSKGIMDSAEVLSKSTVTMDDHSNPISSSYLFASTTNPSSLPLREWTTAVSVTDTTVKPKATTTTASFAESASNTSLRFSLLPLSSSLTFPTTCNVKQIVCMTMDYCPLGDTASYLLRQGAAHGRERNERSLFPSEHLFWHWTEQLASALVALHSLEPPLVHGGIRPDNVFLRAEDEVFLADFGAAFGATRDVRCAGEGQTSRARSAFAAPELSQRQSKSPLPPTDLWSLGCTLFAWSTGNVGVRDAMPLFGVLDCRDAEETFLQQQLANYSTDWRRLVAGLLRIDASSRLSAKDVLEYAMSHRAML